MNIFESKMKVYNKVRAREGEYHSYDATELYKFMDECRILNVWV